MRAFGLDKRTDTISLNLHVSWISEFCLRAQAQELHRGL